MIPNNFDQLYSTYYKKAFLFTRSYIFDLAASEDIASESLIKLWELMKNNDIEYPQALLITILKNKALDYLKHQKVKVKAISKIKLIDDQQLNIRISTLEACNPEEIFSTEIAKIIEDTFAKLPKQTLQVFQLSRYDNKTNKEIADMVNITVKGVEYHINKSLKILRIALKDYLTIYFIIKIFDKYF